MKEYKTLAHLPYVIKSLLYAFVFSAFVLALFITIIGELGISIVFALASFSICMAFSYIKFPVAYKVVKIDANGLSFNKIVLKWSDINSITIKNKHVRVQHGSRLVDDIFGTSTYIDYPLGAVIFFNADLASRKKKGNFEVCIKWSEELEAIIQKNSNVRIDKYDGLSSRIKTEKKARYIILGIICYVVFFVLFIILFKPELWKVALVFITFSSWWFVNLFLIYKYK